MRFDVLSADRSVVTLPLVGRDQGWGWFGPNIGAFTPPPRRPHQGGGAARGLGPLSATAPEEVKKEAPHVL